AQAEAAATKLKDGGCPGSSKEYPAGTRGTGRGKAFHLEGEERFSAHAKVNSAAAAVDEQRDADDFRPRVLDHVQHFPDGAARGHHVLDDEHPFARSDGKTSPKGHSPSLALGKDRPGIKVLADLVGEEDAPH